MGELSTGKIGSDETVPPWMRSGDSAFRDVRFVRPAGKLKLWDEEASYWWSSVIDFLSIFLFLILRFPSSFFFGSWDCADPDFHILPAHLLCCTT